MTTSESKTDRPWMMRLWSLAGVITLENPIVQCPACDEFAPLATGFSYLAAGVNGVEEGSADDLHLFECGKCQAKLSDKDLAHILRTDVGDSLKLPDDYRLMCAQALYDRLGTALMGRWIETWPMGEYPGGHARIIEIHPDPNALEVVFIVKNSLFENEDGSHTIGVLDYELVQLARVRPAT
jgi:hypothetical protein